MNWKLAAAFVVLWSSLSGPAPAAEPRATAEARAAAERSAADARTEAAARLLEGAAPVTFGEGEYRMGPEDVVQFHVWKEADLSTEVVVRPDGKISLPLLGEIEAVGKSATQLQEETTKRLKQYITDPVVTVIIKEINSPKISVLGQVKRPDVYHIKQRMTVLDAIALAGGFTEYADRNKVIIIRGAKWGVQRIKLNLKPLIKDGRSSLAYVQPADTVYVE